MKKIMYMYNTVYYGVPACASVDFNQPKTVVFYSHTLYT